MGEEVRVVSDKLNDPHAWIRGGLRLTRAVIDRVDEEAKRGFASDEESCGLLLGPSADPMLVDEVFPMENRANKLHALDPEQYPRTGRMYFDIDPLRFERAVRAGETSGRPVKVLYHSHLDVGAYFSETDAAAATMGGDAPTYPVAYLVTSIRGGVVDDRKLFVWDADTRRFVEAPHSVIG
jgi:proteasome lid subunit RPN8/RPN11